MKKKTFWFPLLAALCSMVILYTTGNLFDISILSWNCYKENPSEGILFEAGGSVIPIIIGFIMDLSLNE
ncbi:hypothetical protein [Bacillus marinisedimentorum]|uniref:hypothetical protein n=1 Tax=Bacillus marinisedimentorum TaxID=1821260 RepID=UPI0007E06BA5|nr:hypothetical protein [Bacillus marinisedimentorum]